MSFIETEVLENSEKNTVFINKKDETLDYLLPIREFLNGKEPEDQKEKNRLFKNNCKVVSNIASMYNISFQRLLANGSCNVNKYLMFDSKGKFYEIRQNIPDDTRKLNYDERRIVIIDMALLNLTNAEAKVLFNDFFFPQVKKWWVPEMGKSTYYRTKREAVKKFVSICILWNKKSLSA